MKINTKKYCPGLQWVYRNIDKTTLLLTLIPLGPGLPVLPATPGVPLSPCKKYLKIKIYQLTYFQISMIHVTEGSHSISL